MKRIAIYSRKSKFTGKGDSIENQIEMCQEYIKTHIGNDIEFTIYEDEGYSGGSIYRPKFLKLIEDIKLNKIDILVCYKLDRISRNVSDFSSTLDILAEHKCEFISIKEQFDTTTPMGRAMIYISSVFAQLERETIAERVKDNMLEMAKNGKWTGGNVPLGFKSIKKDYIDSNGLKRSYTELVQDEADVKLVKLFYEKYLELKSLHKLEVFVAENNLKSKSNVLYEKTSLRLILKNPVYVNSTSEVVEFLETNGWSIYGEPDGIHSFLTYNKTRQSKKNGKNVKVKRNDEDRIAAVSTINGFIDPSLWMAVQELFNENKEKFPRLGKTHNALLVGKIKCGKCGKYMLVQHGKISKVTGKKMFYYICSLKRRSHKKLCSNSNAKASDIEYLVLSSLKNLYYNKEAFITSLKNDISYADNSFDIQQKMIVDSIDLKKKQIDNLVTKLSYDTDVSSVLLPKIKELKVECENLESKLNKLKIQTDKNVSESINLDIIINLLEDCKNIDKLDFNKQKLIIDTLIDSIYWYGDGKVKIVFIGSNDNNDDDNGNTNRTFVFNEDIKNARLSFSSPSMCKVIETATFRKIFSTQTVMKNDLYDKLPNNTNGQKIYKLRMKLGLTQKQFATKATIGFSSLCKYESEKFNISLANKNKIISAFDLSKDFFI